jgi:hypothetical protein
MDKSSDSEAVLVLVMRNLFEEMGLPQRYSHVHMQLVRKPEHNEVAFVAQSVRSLRPEGVPVEAEQLPMENLVCTCTFSSSHQVSFACKISFGPGFSVPLFAEKMVGLISYKMFHRVKQFIENVRM